MTCGCGLWKMHLRSIVFLTGLCACTADPCDQLCTDTTDALSICLEEWPATWSDVGASSKSDFSNTCSNLWAAERSTLEPRALDDAYEQCDESLLYLYNNSQLCDQLRAIYILPKNY